MMGDTFTVSFVRFKTCFLYVPDRWVKKLQENRMLEADSFLKVIHDTDKVMYFSWQRSNGVEQNCIGISATVANNLGLKEGDSVCVIMCAQPTPLQGVTVSPITTDDLEMIESSSGIVQSTLLNQVRIVYPGQLLTIWISNSLPVTLKISSLEPDVPFGRLEQMTDMTIGSPGAIQSSSESNNESSVKKGVSSGEVPIKSVSNVSNIGNFQSFFFKEKKCIFRVLPLSSESSLYGPCDVFLTKKEKMKILLTMNNISLDGKDIIVCKISKLRSPKSALSNKTPLTKSEEDNTEIVEKSGSVDSKAECASIYVRLRSLDELHTDDSQLKSFHDDCVFVSNNLRRTMDLEIGSHLKFTNVQDASQEIQWNFVELIPFHGVYFPDYAESLFRRVQQTSDGLFLSSKMLLTLPSAKGFTDVEVRLNPSAAHFVVAFPAQLHLEKVKLKLEKPYGKQHNLSFSTEKFQFPRSAMDDLHLSHINSILKNALLSLETTLGFKECNSDIFRSVFIRCNILITGKKGSGKSSTACALCYTLQRAPYYVHFTVLKCRPLRGKKVENILKTLQYYIADCVYHQPSILILDDLESIAGVTDEQDQNNPRGLYFNRVGKMVSGLVSQVQSNHRIGFIATAPSTSCLSSSIMSPRGVHFFNTFIEQPELSKDDRQGVLCKLLARRVALREIRSVINYDALSSHALQTEGYSCQDISDLLEKAVFAACKRQGQADRAPVLETSDINDALLLSTPMLLRGVSLHKESTNVWDDVGGLAEVKGVLKEVLQWPVLYPSLFSNSPLRHQSGLLLYGAPGTGKTMLAGAVANECGLNFISVKGPELLSKYIGASEASVRNIFQKAQSAKPCILFFDEFDSLAPRRGHDSTGVTDRVVNQLLTQLDGVESLSGVWVLAATSRPDLLDPALLRPGRLDRSVLCPLPTQEERLAILHALSRKLTLDSDLNLSYIANSTDGFTGADLQSILYTAQLNAVEEGQSKIGGGSPDSNEVVAVIKQKHLDEALKDTRPSLSLQERIKYIRIYEKFRGAGNVGANDVNARATLA